MKTNTARHETGHNARPTFASFTMAQLNAFIAGYYAGDFYFDEQFRAATLERNSRDDNAIARNA